MSQPPPDASSSTSHYSDSPSSASTITADAPGYASASPMVSVLAQPPAMSSPYPALLIRPPVPGAKASRAGPRLGLSIPVSPSQRPHSNPPSMPDMPPLHMGGPSRVGPPSLSLQIGNPNHPPSLQVGRPAPPQLRLATPSGSHGQPESVARFPGLHLYTAQGGGGLSNGSDKSTDQHLGGRPSIPSSAASSAAQSSASYGQAPLQIGGRGTPDPSSAISVYSEGGTTAAGGMERQGSSMGVTNGIGEHVLPDLSKLRLDKGRDLDVDDLDDDGWMAASKDGMIEELGTLGEGAGGAVTKCRLKGGKTVFALKIITADPDPDMQKQIRRELQFNQKIAEAHICRYYGAYGDSSSGIISIVMEYCEGGSLDVVYKEVKKLGGRIGEKVLGKIAEGVLDGLTYLYKQKIIHRDIKPSNILLCRDGTVKLCDFGVSGEFGTRGDANTFIGTSYYMAPERITGQSYNINSDVWSLGVSLLEVAQHRFPFPADGGELDSGGGGGGAGLIDIIQYIVGQPLPKLKDEEGRNGEGAITWSENFKEFIDRCLERNPQRRATPWRMLEHPWMVDMKAKKVNTARFLQQVWNWTD